LFQKAQPVLLFRDSERKSHYPFLHQFPKKEQFTEGAKGKFMKRKLFMLVAGFGFVLANWSALPVQGEGGQTPTPQYVSGAQHPELAKLLDGPVPICFPGDQKCR
jgi:hypothetical protein